MAACTLLQHPSETFSCSHVLSSVPPPPSHDLAKSFESNTCSSIPLRRTFHVSSGLSHGKRPRGFWNLGRSCHLSATLVALSAVPVFHSYVRRVLLDEKGKKSGGDQHRIAGLEAMIKALEEAVGLGPGHGGVDPRAVARWIEDEGKAVYRVKEEQDAYETFGKVLEAVAGEGDEAMIGERGLNEFKDGTMGGWIMNDKLGEDMNRNKDVERYEQTFGGARISIDAGKDRESIEKRLLSPFEGLMVSVRRCKNCRYSPGIRLERFSSLSLDLPNEGISTFGVTLEDCLWTTYGKANLLDGILCIECNGTQHELHSNIARLPQVLCLHLQRIVWHEYSPSFITTPVSYPKSLKLPSRWMQHADTDPLRPPVRRYTLEAVVQHHGNYKGGHYTALRGYPRTEANESGLSWVLPAPWYLLNDDKSSKVDPSAAQSSSAYLLFYVAQTSKDHQSVK